MDLPAAVSDPAYNDVSLLPEDVVTSRPWRAGLLLSGLLLVQAGCVQGDGEPAVVTLAQLAAASDSFDGELVSTRGVINMHDDPRHYWIEDDEFNRVQLLPKDTAAPHVGAEVRVIGRFSASLDDGRRIDLDRIEPISD